MFAGTKFAAARSLRAMRTGYPQTEGTGAAIALYLAVSMFVCGLFGFGFYNMLQPRQIQNPGLAAYRPPPATVINYPAASQFAHPQSATSQPPTEEPSDQPPEETTGRAVHVAEPAPSMPSTPAAEVKRAPVTRTGKVRSASTRAHEPASPKPQGASGGTVAAYPGYAAIH
jgi:hypothetical protein